MIDVTYISITSKSDKEANRESAKKNCSSYDGHLGVAQVSPQRLSF